jgi:hypothetical protein
MAAFSSARTSSWAAEHDLERSLLTIRDGPSSLVQVLKQWSQFDLVNTCRIANTHESRHEVEESAPHIRAAPTQEYVSSRGTTLDDLSDLHITGYLIHYRLLMNETAGEATLI